MDGTTDPPDESTADATEDRPVSRRDMVHELAAQGLPVAGSLLSTTGALARALRAAGDALATGLDMRTLADQAPAGATPAGGMAAPVPGDATGEMPSPGAAGGPAAVPPLWSTSPGAAQPAAVEAPVPPIGPEVESVLGESLVAVVAANGSDGRPHLVSLRFRWDGEAVLLISLGWSALVRRIRENPAVTICAIDPTGGRFATIAGDASIVEGPEVRGAAIAILARSRSTAEAEDAWRALEADGDRVILRIRPVRSFAGSS